ncbi:hypothetical protein [Paenibacillus humicus]|uniref:hypothetical protein n=1 Tax=Paenibacillus humicus TaxID=412861 RepID=UPI000FD70F51|nr:hypothetical protein [Paenibacillus humicus]
MNYSLYIASVADDKRAAYSWCLVNYEGVASEGVYLTHDERRFDETYCAHVALQRALREAARQAGKIRLRIVMDEVVSGAIGYEILDANRPLYPALLQTTKRVLRRFDDVEFAAFRKDDADALPEESAVIDDAMTALEDSRTLAGQLRLWRDLIVKPSKFIR